jgi:signal transduction histidine kinase
VEDGARGWSHSNPSSHSPSQNHRWSQGGRPAATHGRWGGPRRGAWHHGEGWPDGPPWRGSEWRASWADGQRPHGRPFAIVPVLLVQVLGTALAARGEPGHIDAFGYALLVVGAVALAVVRRAPLVALGVTLAATATYLSIDYPRGPFFVAAVVALFVAVRRANRTVVWAMCGLAYAAYVAVTSLGDSPRLADPSFGTYALVAAWTAVAVALAEGSRIRAAHFAEMARTREESRRARSEQARRQASDERLRIARELHDVLGHHLSLINVRAGVALHLLDSRPEQAREALDAIKQASAEALREVRGVLSTLHPTDETAPRSPAPGLDDLGPLVEEARAAGLAVDLRIDGDPATLAAEVDRAAYRIVQEALTNVRRHAGSGAAATVTIGYEPEGLTLRVDDTGVGVDDSTPDDEGNGIPGMRERAAALGGTLAAGPNADGGFRVEAHLPTTTRAESP